MIGLPRSIAGTGENQPLAFDGVDDQTARVRGSTTLNYSLDPAAIRLFAATGIFSRTFGCDGRINLSGDSLDSRTYGYDAFERKASAYLNGALVGDYRNTRPATMTTSVALNG